MGNRKYSPRQEMKITGAVERYEERGYKPRTSKPADQVVPPQGGTGETVPTAPRPTASDDSERKPRNID